MAAQLRQERLVVGDVIVGDRVLPTQTHSCRRQQGEIEVNVRVTWK
jgi:hypothetical protein